MEPMNVTTTPTDIESIWNEVLTLLAEELSESVLRTWFSCIVPVDLSEEGVFTLAVQNDFARAWLEDRYTPRITAALNRVTGADLRLAFIIVKGSETAGVEDAGPVIPEPAEEPEVVVKEEPPAPGQFDSKYTFDSFVVGDSNAFARNAALAVAEQPGLKYNPLFLWGGPGLGKTHLLQAIGDYVTQNFPHKKVSFVTSEQFTNDFIASINSKTQDTFRQKYRSVDVLLIDDIQFLENKQGTQDQFFHTFNELRQRGKAVVLASDRPPKDINMEERYRSRFASGLIADIQPPNYETRLAILHKYVESQNIPIDDDVLEYTASVATSNIREMEGAIIRIIAWKDLSRRAVINLDLAKDVLRSVFPEHTNRPIAIPLIQREISRFYNVSHADLVGSKRSQSIVYPRQVAMYLARELTDLSLPKIGAEFGGRDHTTVMHATAKIQKMMGTQRDVYNQIQQLTNAIKQKS